MLKNKKRNICILITLLISMTPAFTADAADRNSVKQSGQYYSGSVYGPSLSGKELNEVADAVAAFLNEYIVDGMTELQKVRTACDFIDANCSYAETWSKNRANTAWGSLVYHEAQCSGYARGFKALCDGMGINCYYVRQSGAGDSAHQWNEVQIDGTWYIIDTTFMDQASDETRSLMSAYAYLVSADAYYNKWGYGWDPTGLPECNSNYETTKKCQDIMNRDGNTYNFTDYTYISTAYSSEAVKYVYSGTQDIYVNDFVKTVQTYNIDDYNYIKLRDIAAIVDGTDDNFNIVWDGNNGILWIDTHTPYSYAGGELQIENGMKGVLNPTNVSSFRINGIEQAPECYQIRNNNYYKLRDIGELIG
ncbi:MAG: transglutaminase domain-containing protein, partial [Candidatus Ornithomonoglobus sp.]